MAIGNVAKDIASTPPNFSLTVGDKSSGIKPVAESIRALITSLEYESADGLADLLKFQINDPPNDQGRFPIRESKLFAPGNELGVAFGYGAPLKHVGRVIIRRTRPVYPSDGIPFVEVVGYTKDMVMADSKPEPLRERKKKKKLAPGESPWKNSTASARFADAKFSDVIRDKAEEYGMIPDVDDTQDEPHDFIQKAKMSDYDFVQGLSNLTGHYFWVDGDAKGNWTLHFKNPETMKQEEIQDREYEFKYNAGDLSSIINFEPELVIQEAIVKFKVVSKHPETGELFEVTIEENQDESPDVKVIVGGETSTLTAENQTLDKDFSSASDVKLFLNDFSFDIRSTRVFRSENELARWALAWFRRQRNNFILGRLQTIGVEGLMARQEHLLGGLGIGLNGRYFFNRVRHQFSSDGYRCDCSVRKVIKQQPASEEVSTAFDLGDVE